MKHLGGLIGEVDDAAWDNGSPVIDAHVDYSSVVQVSDADEAAERQSRVRRSEITHVERFATGGSATLEILAVPGCGAYLVSVRVQLFGCCNSASGPCTLRVLTPRVA